MVSINPNKNPLISVKQILSLCWEDYTASHSVAEYQIKEVNKAINCYGNKNGCFVYYCKSCDKWVFESMGCNSRICSCCGKRYNDQWSCSLSQAMFPVPHRHFVMSVPDLLWPYLRDWRWLKGYMNSAIKAFSEFFSYIVHTKINVGVIVVLHPFGKDMRFQPHLHLLITEGGFDMKGQFVKCTFIPADKFRKKWQYEILKTLQSLGLPNELATYAYKKYSNGFYVWLHKRGTINDSRLIAKYVGRYVRHPAIANSRIFYFDGKTIKFYYVNNEDCRINVTMTAEQFITSLIQHIPPSQFKMIRYYGAYARRTKGKYNLDKHSSIRQLKLYDFGFDRMKYCPKCHNEMTFVMYLRKPPPEEMNQQRELIGWISK